MVKTSAETVIDKKIEVLRAEAQNAAQQTEKWKEIFHSCQGGIITLEQVKAELEKVEKDGVEVYADKSMKPFDNNEPKNPSIDNSKSYKIIEPTELMKDGIKDSGGTRMSAIKGDETNTIEKCPLQGEADKSDKPLVATGQQVVKAAQGGKKK
jgi:hypothetical protein